MSSQRSAPRTIGINLLSQEPAPKQILASSTLKRKFRNVLSVARISQEVPGRARKSQEGFLLFCFGSLGSSGWSWLVPPSLVPPGVPGSFCLSWALLVLLCSRWLFLVFVTFPALVAPLAPPGSSSLFLVEPGRARRSPENPGQPGGARTNQEDTGGQGAVRRRKEKQGRPRRTGVFKIHGDQ